jgi:hypothetical protein
MRNSQRWKGFITGGQVVFLRLGTRGCTLGLQLVLSSCISVGNIPRTYVFRLVMCRGRLVYAHPREEEAGHEGRREHHQADGHDSNLLAEFA